MSQASKFLSAAAVLLITVLVIVVSVNIYNKGKTSVNDTTSQYDTIMSQYGDAQLSLYDNGSASGAEIVRLTQSMKTNGSEYVVCIATGKHPEGLHFYYTGADYKYYSTESTEFTVDSLSDKGSEYYVNPAANFKSELIKNENDVVTAVVFTQAGVASTDHAEETCDKCKSGKLD